MKKSLSSRLWQQRQERDPLVKMAKQSGFRARSVYKLEELQQQYQILNDASSVIDLGAAPGAWTQYAASILSQPAKKNSSSQQEVPNTQKTIIAVDLLEMATIQNVDIINGDFLDSTIQQQIIEKLNHLPADIILSDMAPNMTGIKSVDNDRAMHLIENVILFSEEHLAPAGHLISKIFQGSGFQEIITDLKQKFHKVYVKKPKSSRKLSRELYVVGMSKKQ